VVCNGVLYWHAGRAEEREFVRSELAADYEAYRRRTGMFLPNPFQRRCRHG
jgi:protein-S-isoprenylcysteine O-methyltransferase Ste14